MAITTVLCVAAFLGAFVPVQSERHSLYYIYTALSKPVDLPGIYEFNAMGLLDDRQIDYYNSKEQKKIPKQEWMKEKMPQDYWEKGTQSRKSKEQWFNVNVNILMERMRHNNSDVHVLQWRHGCEIEKQENQMTFFKGIDEYSYDGQNFLSFDDKVSQWVAPVDAALSTKRKWDNVPILNQYTKGYLEKECVDWLNKFREYGDEQLKKGSPPDVHIFASKSVKDKTKLTLTCLATGFYPRDVTMVIRKYRTPLPGNEVVSTGIRPNHDGTFQLRKSVEISEAVADYDCFVNHATLESPIITKWDARVPPPTCKNTDCDKQTAIGVITGLVIGAVLVVAIVGAVGYMLKKKGLLVFKSKNKAKLVARCDVLLEKADQRKANETTPNNVANAGENAAMLKIEIPDTSGASSLESVNQTDEGSNEDVSGKEKRCDSGQGSSGSSVTSSQE